jgi:hypothetical protein
MDSKSEQTGKLERPAECEEDVETAKRLAQRTLGLDSSTLRRTAREMAELDAVMASDYRSLVALPSAAAARELAGLVASEFQPLHECWKGRRVHFRVKRPAPCCQEIAVHGAPYTAGAGLGLWGFSCAMKAGQGTFVIYLNTAHLPGAVAVTAAHELGHYFQHSMFSGSAHFGFAPMAADFAAHLNYAGELFSDSAAALATFSAKAAGEMARRRHRSMAERTAQAHELAHPEYRIDFTSTVMNPHWRLRYLAASIHFMKLRIALLEAAGI